MIYMRIWEGLGNQLFQYAFIRALQLRNNVDVRLCVLPRWTGTARKYELDNLRITIPRDYKFEKIARCIEQCGMIKKVVKKVSDLSDAYGYIEEKNVQYNENLKYLNGNYYISGWLQNENYFKEFESIIRKEIKPKKKIRISSQLKNILNNESTVSVHIRRSDFVKGNNLLSREYYKKSLAVMEKRVENAFYVVFSDDLEWVMKHMRFGENVYFVNADNKLEDYEELFIMSKCRHNIIANSTFSWWGAWLNENKDKIVIGPEKWFSNSKLNIMPDEWIRI